MESLPTRLARRTLPALAAVVGASLVTAGLTAPAYAADPTVADVRGTVTNLAGVPLAGIQVFAYSATTGQLTGVGATDATGWFSITTLESGNHKFVVMDGQFPTGSHAYNSYPYVGEWNGDSRGINQAPAIPVVADTPGPPVTFALEQMGLITGTNTGNGAPLYGSTATAYDVDGGQAGTASSPTYKIDPVTGFPVFDPITFLPIPQGQQAYRLFVRAGTYKVLLDGYNATPGPGPIFIGGLVFPFVAEYFGDTYSRHDGKQVTVAAGQTVAGVQEPLAENLANVVKARIDGQTAPGKTLTANVGRWARQADVRFRYAWTVNGAPVSTTSTYVVQKADRGKKVVLTITAYAGDEVGTAQLTSARIGLANKLSAKAKAVGNGRLRFALILSGKKLAGKFKGKAQVWMLPLESRDPFSFAQSGLKSVTPKLVGKGKVSPAGTATITTKTLPAGKALFMVTYSGSKKAAANQTPWRSIKVR